MQRIIFVIAACFIYTFASAQGDNESIIKPFMETTELGNYTFKKSKTIKLTKAEFDFRAQYRIDFLAFVNQYANASEMEADFDSEDMSDSFIVLMYNEIFAGEEETSPEETAKSAGIDAAAFNKIKSDGQKFISGPKADPSGKCQLTVWTVSVDKEQVDLEFYINEGGEITEYEELWPDF